MIEYFEFDDEIDLPFTDALPSIESQTELLNAISPQEILVVVTKNQGSDKDNRYPGYSRRELSVADTNTHVHTFLISMHISYLPVHNVVLSTGNFS